MRTRDPVPGSGRGGRAGIGDVRGLRSGLQRGDTLVGHHDVRAGQHRDHDLDHHDPHGGDHDSDDRAHHDDRTAGDDRSPVGTRVGHPPR